MNKIGALSILFSWIGLIFLIWRWKGDSSMTFSQHAARYRSSRIYYLVLWAICLPPFTWFLIWWFVPTFHMHWFFTACAWLSSVGLGIAAIIPETVNWKVTVHRLAAFGMAYGMFPMTIMIGLNKNVGLAARIFALGSASLMLAIILFLNHHKRHHSKMLWIQASYVAIFHLSILAATYTI